jgi:hypothetical protein
MIIVKKIDSMERDRILAGELFTKLKTMVDLCTSDSDYACKAVPYE